MSDITASAAPPALPATTSSIVARDFPSWLPPMLVKELRQGLRTRGFVGTLVGFQLVMVVLTLVTLGLQSSMPRPGGMGTTVFTGFFWMVLSVQLLFVTPSRALGGLQLELEARTLDLLMLTRLTAWRVVLGKWISLLAQAALLLIAMAPYLVVRYFTDNADLAGDAGRCLAMLGASAVLTAAGLWGSGVAKVVRVLMAVALGVVLVNILGISGAMFGRMAVSVRSSSTTGIELVFAIFDAALITAFFLVSAVRNIAPPAENHGLFARALPLLALLPAPFAETFGAHNLAVQQLFLAAVFGGFVLMFELGSGRPPMPTHWRDWYRRGLLSRMAGRMAMPGWPSAFLFGMVLTMLWAMSALIVLSGSTPVSREQAQHAAWLSLLAFGGLMFPAVAQSFVRNVAVPRVLLYFFGLGIPALLAGVALWLAESRWKITGFKSVMEAMPFSSFLFALNKTDATTLALAAQGSVAGIVLLLALWRSRSYWQQLGEFEARDRTAAEAGVVQR